MITTRNDEVELDDGTHDLGLQIGLVGIPCTSCGTTVDVSWSLAVCEDCLDEMWQTEVSRPVD